MSAYPTLSDAMRDLKTRGFIYDYELQPDALFCEVLGASYPPDAFSVQEVYHFDGISNTQGRGSLYAIATQKGEKGTLVYTQQGAIDTLSPGMAAVLGL